MKRYLSAVAVLFVLSAVPLFAATPRVVDDVIRMSRAGVSDDSIMAIVQKAAGRYDVTPDDVIAMTEAGVPKPVIKAVVDEAGGSQQQGNTTTRTEVVYAGSPYYPYYAYDPFYDPWYSPRVYLNLGVGRVFYHGGGGWGHGGGHGGGWSHGGGHGRH